MLIVLRLLDHSGVIKRDYGVRGDDYVSGLEILGIALRGLL